MIDPIKKCCLLGHRSHKFENVVRIKQVKLPVKVTEGSFVGESDESFVPEVRIEETVIQFAWKFKYFNDNNH